MKKVKSFIKKHWFIIAIIVISLARFLFTYKLPNFYLHAMNYDDNLMIDQVYTLFEGKFLGKFGYKTLIKGPVFPILLFLIKLYKLNISSAFSLMYIFVCYYFISSLKTIIKEKKYLIIIFLVLLFNPVTYSQDLFQRLYRNSISITELLFFLGSAIKILFNKNNKILNNTLFGISLSLMFLTREDNIWTYPLIVFVIIYNVIKEKNIKTVIISLIPIFILYGSLNLVSFINYKYYGIYTYNEIQKSEFHNTYKKILQIKDDKKMDKVSIPKSTFYKLSEVSKTFGITKDEIDKFYNYFADKKGEIYNGNIIWYYRYMTYYKYEFKNGAESEKYYKKLGKEIDELFEKGILEKEFTMPSSFMAVPTKKQIKKLPVYVIKTILYTTSYKDIKTMTKTKNYKYDSSIGAYYFKYKDYHHTVNITKKNKLFIEIVRQIYKYFTIILSIVSLVIYFKNIFKFDNISIISHLLLICYLLIIGGVAYTHITSFHAIRPLYLGNIYILQNVFILLNIYRLKKALKK